MSLLVSSAVFSMVISCAALLRADARTIEKHVHASEAANKFILTHPPHPLGACRIACTARPRKPATLCADTATLAVERNEWIVSLCLMPIHVLNIENCSVPCLMPDPNQTMHEQPEQQRRGVGSRKRQPRKRKSPEPA